MTERDQNPAKNGGLMWSCWKLSSFCYWDVMLTVNPWIQAGDRLDVICVHGLLISTTTWMTTRRVDVTSLTDTGRVLYITVCVLVMLLCFCASVIAKFCCWHCFIEPFIRRVLRETLCTVFLPRDAMRKRGLCSLPVSVRPFVCPSARHVGGLYPDGWRYHQTSFSAR